MIHDSSPPRRRCPFSPAQISPSPPRRLTSSLALRISHLASRTSSHPPLSNPNHPNLPYSHHSPPLSVSPPTSGQLISEHSAGRRPSYPRKTSHGAPSFSDRTSIHLLGDARAHAHVQTPRSPRSFARPRDHSRMPGRNERASLRTKGRTRGRSSRFARSLVAPASVQPWTPENFGLRGALMPDGPRPRPRLVRVRPLRAHT